MPLGAARLNTLSRVLTVATTDTNRTTGFMNVIANGDAQLSNTQYKFRTGTRGGSIKFDGTGDYLSMNDNADNNLDFGTGDFTVEWFQYLTSLDRFAIDFRAGSSASTKILLYSYPSDGSADDLYFYTTANRITASNCLSANQWQHIVAQRESGTTRLFVDGAQVGSDYSDSNNYAHTELRIWHNSIGAENYTPPGYIDEFRISDTARYSGTSYTVPTAAFTQDNHTKLLLHGDGPVGSNGNFHIVDDIGDLRPLDIHIQPNAQAGTAPSISSGEARIGETSFRSYDNDGHCEFATPSFGSAYTIEFWFRADNTTGDQYMAGVWGGSPHGGFTWTVYLNGTTLRTYVWGGSSYVVNNVTVGSSVSANTWHHFAISWDGSTYRTFYDGTMGATVSSTTPPNYEQWSTTWIGTVGGTTSNFSGYIDAYRMSSVARYTSNFTPVEDYPFRGDDADTKVLLNFEGNTGDTITTDDVSRSTWTNGSWGTTTGKFNTGFSMTSGTTGSIQLPGGVEFDDGETITIEFWFQSSILGTSSKSTKIFATAPIDDDNYSTASSQITLEVWEDGNLYLNGNQSGQEVNLGNPGSGTWHHFALQYDGTNNMRVWLNGTHKTSKNHNIGAKTVLYWGNRKASPTFSTGTNYIDEIRISSVNRYAHSTTNFTAPTTAFTNDDDTLALFHCETTDQTDDKS